jgi:hypothetical protein
MWNQSAKQKIHKLFWGCLVFSATLHLAVLLIIYSKPFWIAKFQAVFRRFSPQENVVYTPKEFLLGEALDDLIVVPRGSKGKFETPFPTLERSFVLADRFYDLETVAYSFAPQFDGDDSSILFKEGCYAALMQAVQFPVISPSIALAISDVAYLSVPITFTRVEERQTKTVAQALVSQEPSCPLSSPDSLPAAIANRSVTISEFEPATVEFPMQHILTHTPIVSFVPKSLEQKQTPLALSSLKLPSSKDGTNWNELYAIEVSVMPRKEQKGAYFALTLKPNSEALERKLKQNFHFLIDASSKADKYRVSAFKKALAKATSYFAEGQTFNIHVIGKEIYSLSENSLEYSKKSQTRAKEFLEQTSFEKGLKAKGSLFSALNKIQKGHSSGVDTIVLITDGGFLKERGASQLAENWLKASFQSPIVLHIATAGNDSHSPLLDALATTTGGKVLHSATYTSFPRKFAKLLIDLKAPIATGLSTQLDLRGSYSAITLIGTSCKLAPLYASQPATFFGVANDLSHFTFNVQGWNEESPIELCFDVDLENAEQGSMSMKQLTLQDKAEHELSLFLSNGEKKHLEQAMEWLTDATQTRKR